MIFLYHDAKPVEMFPGVTRRTLAVGEALMLTEFTYEAGSKVPMHHHPHEQISYVVKGQYRVTIEEAEIAVEKGDSYLIPPNTPHAQAADEFTVTVDIFSPPREEYKM